MLLVLVLSSIKIFAQESPVYTLHGIVLSQADGQPLPGATVKNRRTNAGVVTGSDGTFRLSTSDTGGVLVISFVGFRTSERNFDHLNTGPFRIQLASNANMLNEVTISTGYQVIPKERATGSFAQVDNQLLNRRVSPDVLGRLEGVVPGLIFNRNTANGSQGLADISIRGNSTLFAGNQPLIVIDGFPYDGEVSTINPNTVESITVLKDAAAASIWGVRSGNGVIVITTKKGKRNQRLSIDLNANVTVSSKPNLNYSPDYLPSDQFIAIEKSLFSQGYYDADLANAQPTAVSPVVHILNEQRAGKISATDVDAQISALSKNDVRKDLSQYFYRRSVSQQYALNVKGGGERDDYYFAAGYDKNLANLQGNQNDRISLVSRYNFYPVKNLQVSAGLNYTQANRRNNTPVGAITTGSYNTIYPYARLADGAGNALSVIKRYPSSFTDTIGHGQLLDWNYRPLDELRNADNKGSLTDNRINVGIKYTFLKYLNAQLNYQYQRATDETTSNYSLATYYARNLINQFSQLNPDGSVSYPIPLGGIQQQSGSLLRSKRVRAQLDYQQSFHERHEITAILGAELGDTQNESHANTVYGYDAGNWSSNGSVDYISYYNLTDGGAGTVPTTLGLGKRTDRFVSYYTNAAYTYLKRYTVSVSGRIDKSNLFGVATNDKGVPLYSGGLAWNISQEPFYRLGWLSYAKLRATYGYNGNVNNNATAVTTIRQFDPVINLYSPIPYSRIVNPGNPELRWEKIRMINLGLDYALKNNVISGSVEFYFKKGTDLFGYSPIAPSTGMGSFFGNTADIKGDGFDIQLNTRNIESRKFSWTSNLLLSHATDRVTRYGTTLTSSNYIALSNASSIYPMEGKDLYGLYSYRWAGLDPATGAPRGYAADGQLSQDYNAILSGTSIGDMAYNGSSRPQYFGSVRNTFSYNSFSLSLNFTYKLKYYFRRSSYISSGMPWSANRDFEQRWQKPGDEAHTSVPSQQQLPYDQSRDAFYSLSSALVEKGDHVRLQDVSLTYDLDKAVYKRLPFRHMQLYTYVNNVGIIWRGNHQGLDPDLLVGSYLSSYPLPRTISLGIKITP